MWKPVFYGLCHYVRYSTARFFNTPEFMFLFDRNVSLDSVGLPSNGRRDHKKNSHVWNTCGSSEAENSHSWNGMDRFHFLFQQYRTEEVTNREREEANVDQRYPPNGGGAGHRMSVSSDE